MNLEEKYKFVKLFFDNEETLKTFDFLCVVVAKFTNLLRDSFNYPITREEAKRIKIVEALDLVSKEKSNPELKKLFKKFSNLWSKYYHTASQIACKDASLIKDITLDDPLSTVMIHQLPELRAMTMAAALYSNGQSYSKLFDLFKALKEDENYKNFQEISENEETINVQDANESQ